MPLKVVEKRGKVEKLRKAFEGHEVNSNDNAGYIDPHKSEEENYYTDANIYSYVAATELNLEPVNRMNQVTPQVCDQPSSRPAPSPPAPSPPAPSPPPCFFITDLRTGVKVWFGAISMTLLIIGIGYLSIFYSPGKTIFSIDDNLQSM